MPWWWNALQETARSITLFLDKSGDDHRKCPQCRGSGLLHNKHDRKLVRTNSPCWFCEGVGALPVIGLSGFVLARATSHLQALDSHTRIQPLDLPVLKAEHNKCRFSTFSLKAKVPCILKDLNELSLVQKGSLAISGANNQRRAMNTKSGDMRIRRSLPPPFYKKKANNSKYGYSFLYPNLAPLVQAVEFSAMQKTALSKAAGYTFPQQQLLTGFLQNSWIPMLEAPGKPSQINTIGKWRCGRKPRNRIREKAAKQARERGRIVMQKLKDDDKYEGIAKQKCKNKQLLDVNKH